MQIFENISTAINKITVIHVILVSFAIHMFVISQPNFEMLDEVHFTNFMRWFMLGIDHTPYQLPGLSIITSPFVHIFGDNWLSWRFPIVLFGMVFLFFYYKVVEHISNKKIALLTTIILSFSPVIFVSSSLMLRDMPVMAAGFLSLYLYFKQKYYFAALLIGLSAIIKETAIFFMIFIALWHVCTHTRLGENKITFNSLKKPIIFLLIVSITFLTSLYIYENVVTVLEYTTKHPEYISVNDNGELKATRFNILSTNTELLQKPVNDFNYLNKVKDPIHHLEIILTKGYYNQNEMGGDEFMASFLPIAQSSTIHQMTYGYYNVYTNDEGIELHEKQYHTLWIQSMVDYSWWHIGFWSSVFLIVYSIIAKFKNNTPITKTVMFLSFGFVFFVPYLLINMIRDTFAYYMIYFLPVMAVGLMSSIYKIPNKKLRLAILSVFLVAILFNFVRVFPMWGFE